MLARAGLLVMAMVDALMIGRISSAGLAHYGLATAPFLLGMLTGIAMLIGTVVLVGQAHGQGELRRCGVIWRLALLEAVVYGVAVSALFAFGPAILTLAGQTEELAQGGGHALRALAIGLVPMLIFSATSLFLEGLGRPRPGMVVMLAANVLNAGLNALFLFGGVDVASGPAAEASLATSLTRYAMAAALVGYVLRLPERRALGIVGPLVDGAVLLRKLLRLGVPLALSNFLESATFTALAMFAGWLGTVASAAYLVCLNLTSLVYMLAIGLATATAVRVANAVGRDDPPGLRLAGWTGVGLGALIMFMIAPLIATFRASLAQLYTDDPAVLAVAVPGMLLVAAMLVVDALQGILIGALRGRGDVWLPIALQAVAFLAVTVPLAAWLAFGAGAGVPGLLMSLVVGLGIAAILLGARFHQLAHRPAIAL